MNSRRSYRSARFSPLAPTLSGVATLSLKNLLGFVKQYSHAGVVAGVFFGCGSRGAYCARDLDLRHRRRATVISKKRGAVD